MALTLEEIKELLAFGREIGLQSLNAGDLQAVYGGMAPEAADERPSDLPDSPLPEELRHYSALGKAAFGKGR